MTKWTFVDKVMSLLFNMLSRLVITFLPRSKRLFISWLQSPSTVILPKVIGNKQMGLLKVKGTHGGGDKSEMKKLPTS